MRNCSTSISIILTNSSWHLPLQQHHDIVVCNRRQRWIHPPQLSFIIEIRFRHQFVSIHHIWLQLNTPGASIGSTWKNVVWPSVIAETILMKWVQNSFLNIPSSNKLQVIIIIQAGMHFHSHHANSHQPSMRIISKQEKCTKYGGVETIGNYWIISIQVTKNMFMKNITFCL